MDYYWIDLFEIGMYRNTLIRYGHNNQIYSKAFTILIYVQCLTQYTTLLSSTCIWSTPDYLPVHEIDPEIIHTAYRPWYVFQCNGIHIAILSIWPALFTNWKFSEINNVPGKLKRLVFNRPVAIRLLTYWLCKVLTSPPTAILNKRHHDMEALSTLLALCRGNLPVTGKFLAMWIFEK